MTGVQTCALPISDLISIPAAIYAVAALTALSGLVVAFRMYETHPQ